MKTILKSETVFSTHWFDVVARTTGPADPPYYALEAADFVSVLATTSSGDVVLVRQYRPPVEKYTLELPSGHVDQGESPEDAARRELLEETGYRAGKIELLGALCPDTGRMANRIWCFFAPAAASPEASFAGEDGVEVLTASPAELSRLVLNSQLEHALYLAVLMLSGLQGKFRLEAA